MTPAEATTKHWTDLKRSLIASVGRDGAAAFLEHAAAVMRMEAKREALDTPREQELSI